MIVSNPSSNCCCPTAVTITTTTLVSYILENVADLRAMSSTLVEDNELAHTLGYYSPGDGGGDLFYWASEEPTVDNGGTIIKPTDKGAGLGRWMAIELC